jgi:hypothetical protein
MSVARAGGGGVQQVLSIANATNVATNASSASSSSQKAESIAQPDPASSKRDPASLISTDSDDTDDTDDTDDSDSEKSVELKSQKSQVTEASKPKLGTNELYPPAAATERSLNNQSKSNPFKRALRLQALSSLAPSQGRNTDARNALISATGREFGPDIALKVGPNIDSVIDKDIISIINKNSSITEVLNILAFLLNKDEQRKGSVIEKFSYDKGKNSFADVRKSLTESTAPFNITTLITAPSAPGVKITIPRTILRRDDIYDLKKDIIIESNQIQPLISACILQMINILENTREVFGGWAKLFKGMQGGSSKSKTKKTRRRH